MKLERRFLFLVTGLFVFSTVILWLVFTSMTSEINREWGLQFVERQVLFDKYRTFAPLLREIDQARLMAAEPALVRMARHENDSAARRAGLALLERYRARFGDHSFFAAFSATGHYYYDDASGRFPGNVLRYTLFRDDPDNGWFYATLREGRPYQINIAQDAFLKVTKVWINVLLRDGDEVLGVVGTGMSLKEFLAQTVSIVQPGIHNFFIDDMLSIKLSGDPSLIDYAAIAKGPEQHVTVSALFAPGDVKKLQASLKEFRSAPQSLTSFWVQYEGRKFLLGVAWLPELGWYDLTLVDQKNLALTGELAYMPYALAALLLMVLVILGFALQQWVLHPIEVLRKATEVIRKGNFEVTPPLVGTGEVRDLAHSFRHMVAFVRDTHHELEQRVRERTEALHRLTEVDGLTGLLNRRGIMARFDNELSRLARNGGELGLLLLDLDHFKTINDAYGHAAGDLALVRAADAIRTANRPYDHTGRYGGEEFLVILPQCPRTDLEAIAERIRATVAALELQYEGRRFAFTASIGMYHLREAEDPDLVLSRVDKALYAAKLAGRNRAKNYEEPQA